MSVAVFHSLFYGGLSKCEPSMIERFRGVANRKSCKKCAKRARIDLHHLRVHDPRENRVLFAQSFAQIGPTVPEKSRKQMFAWSIVRTGYLKLYFKVIWSGASIRPGSPKWGTSRGCRPSGTGTTISRWRWDRMLKGQCQECFPSG